MNRTLNLLLGSLCVLVVIAVVASQPILPHRRYPLRVPSGGAAPTYIINENLEGTGYEQGWTETLGGGTIDEDYTATVLQGSQSLHIIPAGSYTYIVNNPVGLGGLTEYYGYFLVRFITLPTTDLECLSVSVNAVSDELRIVARSDTGWKVANGTVFSSSGGTAATATTYNVWWHYKKSTGGNGEGRIWVATSGTKPGSATAEVTTGDSTATVDVVSPRQRGNTTEAIFDRILVDNVSIGDNP